MLAYLHTEQLQLVCIHRSENKDLTTISKCASKAASKTLPAPCMIAVYRKMAALSLTLHLAAELWILQRQMQGASASAKPDLNSSPIRVARFKGVQVVASVRAHAGLWGVSNTRDCSGIGLSSRRPLHSALKRLHGSIKACQLGPPVVP